MVCNLIFFLDKEVILENICNNQISSVPSQNISRVITSRSHEYIVYYAPFNLWLAFYVFNQ